MTSSPANWSISNARIVLNDRIIDRGSIQISGDRISSLRGEATDGFNLEGATVFPGFIDAHIHGAVGVDLMSANSEQLQQVSKFLASQGITSLDADSGSRSQ